MIRFITDYADQAVILPLVIAICIALLAQGWRRGAMAWGIAIAATFSVMLVLKLIFIACWRTLDTVGIHSPSGHVAAATVLAGGLAALVFTRRTATVIAVITATIIAGSRLALGVHSVSEVLLGAMVGLSGMLILIRLAGPTTVNIRPIIGVVVLILLVFHGLHFPAETHIRETAIQLARILTVCRN